MIRETSKAGGALANRSRPNRRSQSLFEEISPATSSPYEHEAHCYQCFNRLEINESKQKTDGQLCFLLDCYDAPTKMNGNQTHERRRTVIYEKDDGLMFCSMKATSQVRGDLLSKEQICSWNILETSWHKRGNIGGENRLKPLTTHLNVLRQHKEQNQRQYWKVFNDNNVLILKSNVLSAMYFIFEFKGANLREKLGKLNILNLDKNQVDGMSLEVSQRIRRLDSRIQHAKDATFDNRQSKDSEKYQE